MPRCTAPRTADLTLSAEDMAEPDALPTPQGCRY
jgi:hypothetical protein